MGFIAGFELPVHRQNEAGRGFPLYTTISGCTRLALESASHRGEIACGTLPVGIEMQTTRNWQRAAKL